MVGWIDDAELPATPECHLPQASSSTGLLAVAVRGSVSLPPARIPTTRGLGLSSVCFTVESQKPRRVPGR